MQGQPVALCDGNGRLLARACLGDQCAERFEISVLEGGGHLLSAFFLDGKRKVWCQASDLMAEARLFTRWQDGRRRWSLEFLPVSLSVSAKKQQPVAAA
jgi:hypothetical protein